VLDLIQTGSIARKEIPIFGQIQEDLAGPRYPETPLEVYIRVSPTCQDTETNLESRKGKQDTGLADRY
jgi:hypothetical protein